MLETAIWCDGVWEQTIGSVVLPAEEPLIYRTEVLAIIGALADLVGDIRDSVVEDDEGERTEETD